MPTNWESPSVIRVQNMGPFRANWKIGKIEKIGKLGKWGNGGVGGIGNSERGWGNRDIGEIEKMGK